TYGKARLAGEKGALLLCRDRDATRARKDGGVLELQFRGHARSHALEPLGDRAGRALHLVGFEARKARNRLCAAIKRVLLFLRSEEHTSELQSHLNLVC